MAKHRFMAATAVLLLTALASQLGAQIVGGTISGIITDSTGAPLPAATVLVKNLETGAERRLASDDVGHYAAPSLAVGNYSVTASKNGFSPSTKTGVTLVVAQKSEVDIQLKPGEVSQAITVGQRRFGGQYKKASEPSKSGFAAGATTHDWIGGECVTDCYILG